MQILSIFIVGIGAMKHSKKGEYKCDICKQLTHKMILLYILRSQYHTIKQCKLPTVTYLHGSLRCNRNSDGNITAYPVGE